jgi:HlyD family secretion protein
MKSRKWILFFVGMSILAAGGFWLYRSIIVSAAVSEKDLFKVQKVDFPLVVSATGLVEAAKSVSIGPPNIQREHRFKLARMVDEGKEIYEGDFLLEFDGSDISRRLREETASYQRVQEEYQKKRSDFDISLRDLRLQLEQAKSDADKLDNKLNRQAELESAIVIAETQIRRDTARRKVQLLEQKLKAFAEAGRLDLEISRSNQNNYKARMDQLMDAMDSLTVTAPVPGVVVYKRDWNNEARQVGSWVFMRDTVLELPDMSTLRAKVMVDEIDASKVTLGQEADIVVDALQGRVFKGTVTYLSAILKQAAYDRPQKIAEAFVEFSTADLKAVRPGMSCRSSIRVGNYPQVIVIPLSTIREREGRSFVEVWKADTREFVAREIQLVSNDGLMAVVKSGLEANEQIRAIPKV